MIGRRGDRTEADVPEQEPVEESDEEAGDPVVEEESEVSPAEDVEGDGSMVGADGGEVGLLEDDGTQRLTEELERMNDRYLRLAAEFENFRKRTRREQAELSEVAQADFARRLLPTLDDLSRVSNTPPESTTVEALDAGLDLILRNLTKELEEAGLVRIDAMGVRFNPELHQALMTAETADPDLDDTVSRVFVDGYRFRDRLVRPAQVEVLSYEPQEAEDG